jgi:hypothetical protein
MARRIGLRKCDAREAFLAFAGWALLLGFKRSPQRQPAAKCLDGDWSGAGSVNVRPVRLRWRHAADRSSLGEPLFRIMQTSMFFFFLFFFVQMGNGWLMVMFNS